MEVSGQLRFPDTLPIGIQCTGSRRGNGGEEKNLYPRRESNPILWSPSLYIGFEVFTAVVMWVITPCSLLKPTDVSGEHVAFISKVEQQGAFHYCLLNAGFLLGLLFNLEDEGDMFLRNVWSTFQPVIRRCISRDRTLFSLYTNQAIPLPLT
jgi:hypothetical protein